LTQLQSLEEKLLTHDPSFGEDDTAARRAILKNQLLNAFTKGMKPSDSLSAYDSSDPAQAAQLHINIERLRVPEALYQPQMAGVDQAGLLELIGHVLKQFSPSEQDKLCAVSVLDCHFLICSPSETEYFRHWRLYSDAQF